MNECLKNLVGLKSLCDTTGKEPVFYIDDIEGMTTARLAQLATKRDGSGQALGKFLLDSSLRLLLADIDGVIPSAFRIKDELVSLCSSCTFSGFTQNAVPAGTGIVVKNLSNSRFTSMIIDSLKVRVNTTGDFTIRIIDKEGLIKDIPESFVAGEDLSIINIGYETPSKQISIYFTDPTVQLFTVTCPANSSCGCGGSKRNTSEIVISGFTNGIESSTQSGILPCVKIRCSYESIICDLVQSSPRLFGLALLYLFASKAFEENALSSRVNRTASFDKEERQSDSERYYALYRERLTGNSRKNILGISQAINQNLKIIKDKCIACDSPLGVAWATG